MSDRPKFAEVLARHVWIYRTFQQRTVITCACGDELIPATSSGVANFDDFRAHITAALNAEVDRWLTDEGTRNRVANEFGWHLTERTWDAGCTLACGYDGDDMDEHLATAALAALTTPTEPTHRAHVAAVLTADLRAEHAAEAEALRRERDDLMALAVEDTRRRGEEIARAEAAEAREAELRVTVERVKALHPLGDWHEDWTGNGRNRNGYDHTGCTTCETDGPCDTRAALATPPTTEGGK